MWTQQHLGVDITTAVCRGLASVLFVAAGMSAFATEAASQNASTAAQPNEAVVVVWTLIDAMNVNDGARIRGLFAPDASQVYGDGRPKAGRAFFAWLESDIIDRKGQVNDAQFAVSGNEVIVTGQYRNSQGYRSAANFRLVVANGRIVSWQMRY